MVSNFFGQSPSKTSGSWEATAGSIEAAPESREARGLVGLLRMLEMVEERRGKKMEGETEMLSRERRRT